MKNNIKKIAALALLIGLQQAHGNILETLGLEEHVVEAKEEKGRDIPAPAPRDIIPARSNPRVKLPPVSILETQKNTLLERLEAVRTRTLDRVFQNNMKATGSNAQQVALNQQVKGLEFLTQQKTAIYGRLNAFLMGQDIPAPTSGAIIPATSNPRVKLPPVPVLEAQRHNLLAKLEAVQARIMIKISQSNIKTTNQQVALNQEVKGLRFLIQQETALYGQLDAFLTSLGA